MAKTKVALQTRLFLGKRVTPLLIGKRVTLLFIGKVRLRDIDIVFVVGTTLLVLIVHVAYIGLLSYKLGYMKVE